MTSVAFSRATKRAAKLRMAIDGPAGAGKTYTALAIASQLARPVALVDTEHGSASKYADLFEFDTLELDSFHPARFMEAIDAAEAAGFGTIILDSLSHAWTGKDGTLELVDRAARRSQSGNSFAAWKDVTPIQNALIERILASRLHVIVTLRVKTEYVIQANDKGRQEPRKVGLAPVQRDQLEYEFDVYGRLDQDNTLVITKTRCPALSGGLFPKPGVEIAQTLSHWLQDGVEDTQKSNQMVTSADDPMWARWRELGDEAHGLGVHVDQVTLPIGRTLLQAQGAKVRAAVEAKLAQLREEDSARAAGRSSAADGGASVETPHSAGASTDTAEPMVTTKTHPLWRDWLAAEAKARAADLPTNADIHLPISEAALTAATTTLLDMVADRTDGEPF